MIDFKLFAKSDNIKILQMTDMQYIDASQCRYPTRLDEACKAFCTSKIFNLWATDYMDELVERTKPDLIILTGDLVYGEFDDNGNGFKYFIREMDKYNVPWALVWGNHDGETYKGLKWQIDELKKAKNLLFLPRYLEGTSNYNIALYNSDNKLIRMIYMLDSNGVGNASDKSVSEGAMKNGIIGPKTREWFISNYEEITKAENRKIPSFACFHIAPIDLVDILIKKGYITKEVLLDESKFEKFEISDGEDFGGMGEFAPKIEPPITPDFKKINVDGVFMGHEHKNNLSVVYDGIRWTYGLKTGRYDFHDDNKLGGTLITVSANGDFTVKHIYQKRKDV